MGLTRNKFIQDTIPSAALPTHNKIPCQVSTTSTASFATDYCSTCSQAALLHVHLRKGRKLQKSRRWTKHQPRRDDPPARTAPYTAYSGRKTLAPPGSAPRGQAAARSDTVRKATAKQPTTELRGAFCYILGGSEGGTAPLVYSIPGYPALCRFRTNLFLP